MQYSFVADGFESPIAAIRATDLNTMVANLRSAVEVPFGTADRDLLAPDVPTGGVLLAPEVDMHRERPDLDEPGATWQLGTAGKLPRNDFDGDSTNDLK
jgi:hypothetical protein